MFIVFEERASDSPVIDRVWRSHSERAGAFHSIAACCWGIVVSRVAGATRVTVRGPETSATAADCPADGEWVGIQFRLGTFMPALPPAGLRDRNDLTLPGDKGHFLLGDDAWEYPTYENAETFVQRLLRRGLIVRDRCVEAVLADEPRHLSERTIQRRVRRATGMSPKTIQQIGRAREATMMLREGVAVAQVVSDLGYVDQAHLSRSVTRFIGQTPGRIALREAQLSLLYKTPDR